MFERISRWIRFNLRYLGQPSWDTGVSPPELIDFLCTAPPGHALDVGCGTGTNLLTMVSYGWRVVGMDIAWLSVIKARSKLRRAGVDARVINGSVTSCHQLGEPFDLVLDIGCFHSLNPEGRDRYRQNLNRWLNPGGTFLLYAHLQTHPTDPHGISGEDFTHFSRFLSLTWRKDHTERRPDGGGGRPAAWARFAREPQDIIE